MTHQIETSVTATTFYWNENACWYH